MKKFIAGVLIVLIVLAAVGLFLPTEYAIARSVTINAPPEQVHTWVADLEKWQQWGPWHETDPTIRVTFGAKTTGVGASQQWSGAEGDGDLRITKSDPATGIAYEMAFIQDGQRIPAAGALSYQKTDGGTIVTWSTEGDCGDFMPLVVGGYLNQFMMTPGMEEMFDKGLSNLKAKVEGSGS